MSDGIKSKRGGWRPGAGRKKAVKPVPTPDPRPEDCIETAPQSERFIVESKPPVESKPESKPSEPSNAAQTATAAPEPEPEAQVAPDTGPAYPPPDPTKIPKTAAPQKRIKLDELQKLAMMQCTNDEIAAWFGITPQALVSRMTRDSNVRRTIQNGRLQGKASLRRQLWDIAQSGKAGSAAAAIFLAKNLLGYRDGEPADAAIAAAAAGAAAATATNAAVTDKQAAINQIREMYGLRYEPPDATASTPPPPETPAAEQPTSKPS